MIIGTTEAEFEQLGCVIKKQIIRGVLRPSVSLFQFAITAPGKAQPQIVIRITAQALGGALPIGQECRQRANIQCPHAVHLQQSIKIALRQPFAVGVQAMMTNHIFPVIKPEGCRNGRGRIVTCLAHYTHRPAAIQQKSVVTFLRAEPLAGHPLG